MIAAEQSRFPGQTHAQPCCPALNLPYLGCCRVHCVQDGKAQCISVCASARCKDGLECQPDEVSAAAVCTCCSRPVFAAALALLCSRLVPLLRSRCAHKRCCCSVLLRFASDCASLVLCCPPARCRPQKGNPQCVPAAATNPCAFTTCLVGNFCQVEVKPAAPVGCVLRPPHHRMAPAIFECGRPDNAPLPWSSSVCAEWRGPVHLQLRHYQVQGRHALRDRPAVWKRSLRPRRSGHAAPGLSSAVLPRRWPCRSCPAAAQHSESWL